MTADLRYTVGEVRRVRFDHVVNLQRTFCPCRFAESGAPPPYGVLYIGGLVRDLAEGLDGYRFGSDFRFYNDMLRATSVAGRYKELHAVYNTFGRAGHHEDDLAFWQRQLSEDLPTFFPNLIVGAAGGLAVGEAGVLPFDQMDMQSQGFVRGHFRPPPEVIRL